MPPEPSDAPIPLDPDTRATVAGWVRQHWDAVFALLYRMAGSRHEAEDLAQETFLRAARRRGSFAPGTNLRAWLMRIGTNAFLDQRRRLRTADARPLPEDAGVPAPGPEPGAGLSDRELAADLESALRELPETGRLVFLLRTREHLSFREIAGAIGASEETARWHMHQARKRLAERLKAWKS